MMNENDVTRLLRCWGKTLPGEDDPEHFHPAIFHMVDAGQTAAILLEEHVSPRWKQVLVNSFSNENLTWVPWAVAIHDIGKISASFQWQSKPQADRLANEGFKKGDLLDLSHDLISATSLKYERNNNQQFSQKIQIVLSEVMGGHHGTFSPPGDARQAFFRLQSREPKEWRALRVCAFDILDSVFQKPDLSAHTSPFNISSAIMALTGFTILCDWLSSNSCMFPLSGGLSYEDYLPLSRERAFNAVKKAGFMQHSYSLASKSFSKLFKNIATPRPLQTAVDDIPDEILAIPALIIMEAPTGEGKTEAALALAHRIALLKETDEIYYALPTTATSNQMYGRIQDYLLNTLCISTKAKLVHGQAFLLDEQPDFIPLANGDSDEEYSNPLEWFSSKKKALLAPFGVGTIDQAELGALNVPHNALRLVGLAGKTLIVDEVHAYDVYMTTIIERLLRWLSKLGTSVILLSATLPKNRRETLARAFNPDMNLNDVQADKYPCIIVANQEAAYYASPPASQPDRAVAVNWLELPEDKPEQKAQWLNQQLDDHSCLCWITNTVDRAQQIFKTFDQIAEPDVLRLLIHSRYPMTTRGEIEKNLMAYFGPQGQRPNKAVVIGTQILEQSLDLDFDLLVSDLAPADLLLQRAGRCHRHTWRPPEARASRHSQPNLYIYCSKNTEGDLNLSPDRYIYAEYFLRRTWKTLHNTKMLHLPDDYRRIVDQVYSEPVPEDGALMLKAWEKLIREQQIDQDEAKLRLLPEPNPSFPFSASASGWHFDEEEDHSAWIVAKTRKGEESVQVIPLQTNGDYAFCESISGPLLLNQPAERSVQIQLLKTAIRLSGSELCAALKHACQPLPALFMKSALLKNSLPLWMKDNTAVVNSVKTRFILEIHPTLGMIINKERSN